MGREHSADGLGYGPVYYISKYSMSTAFLSTAHFKDQDALSARIIQARFTGHFRFACKAFTEFMSDETLAGAGSDGGGDPSAFANPNGFASRYDRNWIAMASALFAESYHAETGHVLPTGVHAFWRENCEAPAVERSAVPDSLWRLDAKVYGEEDLFSHDVPVHAFAPLRAFGSLRQLRNLETGGAGSEFGEDYTNVATGNDFKDDRDDRTKYSLQSLYRDRICNPTFKYGINDAIGNPPTGGNAIDPTEFIRDASRAKLPRWDMQVPNGYLGASGIRRPFSQGCGLGIASGGCDVMNPPTYYESSLWSWAYVTSSHDPDVAPGWHRLLHLKAFTVGACSANKNQICNSDINRLTHGVNFNLDQAVAQTFVNEQVDRLRNKLVQKLREERRSKNGRRLSSTIPTIPAIPTIPTIPTIPDTLNVSDSVSHRALYVRADGVFDIEGMRAYASMHKNDEIFLKVTDHYWGLTSEEAAVKFDLIRQRLKPQYITAMINGNGGGADPQPSDFRTGKLALYASRCSDALKAYFPEDENVRCCLNTPEGAKACDPEIPYQSELQCSQYPLELASTAMDTLDEEYLVRLRGASPPPSPPPSPRPPPPPSPPNPPPPPRPPIAISASEGKNIALIAQRQFCDAVYMISAESRCSRLATQMVQAFVLGDGFSPPALAPLSNPTPPPPPPPPSPPRPRLPRDEDARIVYQEPLAAVLSTYFLGGMETDPDSASRGLGNHMALDNVANGTREDALQTITYDRGPMEFAACSEALAEGGAPLPCRTGDTPARCINGAEHCGTIDENTRAPWVELNLREGLPTDRDYYFFALEVWLPPDPVLGSLFFASAQGVSDDRGDVTNRFYKLEVFDVHHNPLAVQCKPHWKQSTDFYSAGMTRFQYACLDALAEDAAYAAMRHVRYVRLTLLGEHRMLWLDGMRVLWRTVEALPPARPPPPPVPPIPPQPGAPPDPPPPPASWGCHDYADYSFKHVYPVAFKEPCGLGVEECCSLAYQHNRTAAWHLSPSGCCTLLDVPEADHEDLSTGAIEPVHDERNAPATATTVKVSGARKAWRAAHGGFVAG